MIESNEVLDNGFEAMLQGVLAERSAAQKQPAGLEQRLLAKMRLAAEETHPCRDEAAAWMGHPAPGLVGAPMFGFAESVATKRSRASMWTAFAVHGFALLLVLTVVGRGAVQVLRPKKTSEAISLTLPPPPAVLPRAERTGGGGGQHNLAPVAQGHLPKLAQLQLMPPKAPPTEAAKITIEPTVVLQKDLKMADNSLPNLGLPDSSLHGVSLGNGAGTGIGSGHGAGIGPGAGGNTGGGVMHIGGSVKAPVVISSVEPEFSEEARKAKFSGNVQVYLVVDQHGNPTHVRVVRGVGMGLDEKAAEAVKQYKFKPATQNGKPVEVDMYVDVGFQIF
ncbi:protein TonB [Bryocella elongata]|uniref:Protein TonB n=1 Tax=Bryocella elongata TaxID=863522 RepID=A0A1H5XT35_9BACT|nr:energy transducer TonB [Bryocella elongata]SEG14822.1 protein TonB [Bryocella elongata]